MTAETHRSVRRAALAFIFVTVLLDILALGVIIPVLPHLIQDFVAGDAARAAEYIGLFGTSWAIMQFFASPVIGALSDRYGRRPVILLSNFGLGLDYIVMAMAPSLWWLLLGRLISGVTSASIASSYAYVADVSAPEKRAGAFGLLGAAFGLGFVLGPALGGVLADIAPRLPFWVAACLSLTNFLYGAFVLPESLPPGKRMAFNWRRANPLGSLKLLGRHRELLGIAGVYFLSNLAHAALPSVFVIATAYRYGWSAADVGYVLAAVGICSMIAQAGLVRPIVARLGEARTLLISLSAGIVAFALYGIAPTGLLFLIGIPIMSIWGMTGPASQGLMSRHVGVDEQGQLQGAAASLRSLTDILGPGLFTLTFAYFIRPATPVHLPGAPFFLSALLLAAALALTWRVTRTQYRS
ncbi:MAG TPA: TCR/Tet family MFS transporter [Verrucomicrobiae bacterium]|nr:TCR/Tet family MFS transporter [Verrucomicrobiae bacterium]